MEKWSFSNLILLAFSAIEFYAAAKQDYISAIGDPGMRRDGLRMAIEAWNQCNEVGKEAPGFGSPRMADCFDVDHSTCPVKLIHKVDDKDNKLGVRNGSYGGIKATNVDLYAAKKEIYLGKKCQVQDKPRPWQFWMIMLKSGNMDTMSALCPENGKKAIPFPQTANFPCFGKGCMNMPSIYHDYTSVQKNNNGRSTSTTIKGSFYGTWDLNINHVQLARHGSKGNSYFNVTWVKEIGKGSWVFHHFLKTSTHYPWLMLYLRSDASQGFSGGYHYQTRGMSKIVPKSPNFKVKFRLEVKQGGGKKGQFYLMDMGGCWKNNGKACDGDVTTDVTRYSEMILNPETEPWCKRDDIRLCPPYHTNPNGTKVHRTDKFRFPYDAYHLWCAPGNAVSPEEPHIICDPYSNPQAQEILQILPHPVWAEYGFPDKQGEGWIGDPRSWELDVGRLSQSLYFYQDPGTGPAERYWPSIDIGTEIYISSGQVAEWVVSDFDIIIPKKHRGCLIMDLRQR